MKFVLFLFLYGFAALPVSAVAWLIVFFGFDKSFSLSALWAAFAGVFVYCILIWRRKHKLLKRNQITNKELRYIQSNLKEARDKIKRLNKTLLRVRSFHAMKQIGKLQQTVRKIYRIVEKEPKRFYLAERFFFYHLDSIVELSERYTFLTRQYVKEQEVRQSLSETEQTLEQISNSVEDDLLTVLSNDINHLNIELDVAKHSINREQKAFPKGRR